MDALHLVKTHNELTGFGDNIHKIVTPRTQRTLAYINHLGTIYFPSPLSMDDVIKVAETLKQIPRTHEQPSGAMLSAGG